MPTDATYDRIIKNVRLVRPGQPSVEHGDIAIAGEKIADLAVGYDADIVLIDPDQSFTVSASESELAQGYTPFEGIELRGRVRSTYLRGHLIYHDGNIVGEPRVRYLRRPC